MSATSTWAGYTLVDNSSSSAYYGVARLIEGVPVADIARRSAPRTNGVLEVFSGWRERIHRLSCDWGTSSESTLRAALRGYHASLLYGTLYAEGATFSNCRLANIVWGPRKVGTLGGSAVVVMSAELEFIEVVSY